MKNRKTLTLLDEYDAPEFSILPGHHSVQDFNVAFLNEGWTSEPWPEDYISHEYWVNLGNGKWKCSNRLDKSAEPVTVADWSGPTEQPLARGPAPHLN